MLERMNRYINDKEFRFTVYEDRIHIMNYKRIILLEDDQILLQANSKKISIRGSHLVLNQLLDQELLIKGNITKIEVEND